MTIPHRTRGLLLASIAYLGVVTFWVGPNDKIQIEFVFKQLESCSLDFGFRI
jgi:hypothetical protein